MLPELKQGAPPGPAGPRWAPLGPAGPRVCPVTGPGLVSDVEDWRPRPPGRALKGASVKVSGPGGPAVGQRVS